MALAANATVAFVGLGVMGFPMAGHLAAAGFTVRVYNRSSAKADAWLKQHATTADTNTACATPALAADGADVVCICVGNDDDVRSVCFGADGVFATLAANALLIDHTTASEGLALELASAAAQRGAGFVDAPVSGGQAGAEAGALTAMCGGSEAAFAHAGPVLDCYSKRTRLLGPPGAGQLAKMVNQVCIAGVLQGLAEGVRFAEGAGLEVDAVLDVIAAGAAQSWQMENRGSTMAQRSFDFGFAVDWMRKDLGIALDAARQRGLRLPLTALVDQFYGDVQASGGGRLDTSSLIKRLD
ncbi:MAG: NAD(P)-dependent oxidoreductase [Pseudomonadales bacterium]